MDLLTIDKFYQIYGRKQAGDFTGECVAISATDRGTVVDGKRMYPGIIPLQPKHRNSPVTHGIVQSLQGFEPITAAQAKTLHPRLVEFLSE